MDENPEPDDDLLCGVCRRILNNPHSLICGHAFCKDPCLTSLTSGQGFVRCPFCFIEVEASSVVADSVLAGRLRQYFIRKCRPRPTEEDSTEYRRCSCYECTYRCRAISTVG
nr:unnamed protein product [Spirometra erinaceieuropaei]